MSKISSLFHRFFGGVKRILTEVAVNVTGPAIREISRKGASTDAERRAIVERHVTEYLQKRYPHYDWLVGKAVEFVFVFVRAKFDKTP